MTFDSIVLRLEENLLPSLQREEESLHALGLYKEIEVVSLRHADTVHAIGIRCHPKWAARDLEYLSFIVAVTIPQKTVVVRTDIHWADSFDFRIGSGYLKKEVAPFATSISAEGGIVRFVGHWKVMSHRFRNVACRGRPSSRFVRWMRGAPRDVHGRKTEPNQTPKPTAPSGRGSS